jgi:hypothetical protein
MNETNDEIEENSINNFEKKSEKINVEKSFFNDDDRNELSTSTLFSSTTSSQSSSSDHSLPLPRKEKRPLYQPSNDNDQQHVKRKVLGSFYQ